MLLETKYDDLHHLQVGRIGEYWVKLMLTMQGLDTYYSDVDNKAIDFVVRLDNAKHIDIQVKTIRTSKSSYVFISKDSWPESEIQRDNLYLALVLLTDNEYPKAYLIPSKAWLQPNELLCSMNYSEKGLKSRDEWGLRLSKKSLPSLEEYNIIKQVAALKDLKSVEL